MVCRDRCRRTSHLINWDADSVSMEGSLNFERLLASTYFCKLSSDCSADVVLRELQGISSTGPGWDICLPFHISCALGAANFRECRPETQLQAYTKSPPSKDNGYVLSDAGIKDYGVEHRSLDECACVVITQFCREIKVVDGRTLLWDCFTIPSANNRIAISHLQIPREVVERNGRTPFVVY